MMYACFCGGLWGLLTLPLVFFFPPCLPGCEGPKYQLRTLQALGVCQEGRDSVMVGIEARLRGVPG